MLPWTASAPVYTKVIFILLCTSFIDWGVDTDRLSGRVRVDLARSRFLSFAVLLH